MSVLKQIYSAITSFFKVLLSGVKSILSILSLIPELFNKVLGLFNDNSVFGLSMPSILKTIIPILFAILIIKIILRFSKL